MKNINDNFTLGIKKSIPIVIGYIPVGITFGILCKSLGFPLIYVVLSSFVLYSGAAQFMLVGFMSSNISLVGIAISIFLLNTRLFLMSATIGATVNRVSHYSFPIFGWMLTDEAFSVISFNKEHVHTPFVFGVELPPYFAWGIFSVVGYFIGDFLPEFINLGMGMGLLGLFIAMLVPNVKKHISTLKVVLLTAIIYSIVYYLDFFTMGWDLVFSIVVSSVISVFLLKDTDLDD